MQAITPMVKSLIIINIIFFVGSNFLAKDISYDLFALYFPLSDKFYFWQIFTHIFMHAKIEIMFTHIVFNMLGLYMFGSALEYFWGGKKFLFFYLSCGIGAAMLHIGVQYLEIQQLMNNFDLNLSLYQLRSLGSIDIFNEMPYKELNDLLIQKNITKSPLSEIELNNIASINYAMQGSAVGASGALYGIIVAFAFMFPNAEMMLLFFPFPIKAKYFVPVLVAYDFFAGISGHSLFGGGGIAHFAHVGGALTGMIIMFIWRNKKFNFKKSN
jgi:membrane associated rhomboid family serine protease